MVRILSRLLPLALFACQSSATTSSAPPSLEPAAAPATVAEAPVTPPLPDGIVTREFEIKTPGGDTAKVRVKVPSEWTASAWGYGLKNDFGETMAGVEANVTCDGNCAEPDLSQQLATRIANATEAASKPNLNTGNPELDAVRLDVAQLETGDLPDGKFVIYRVTKPAGLEGPYREELRGVCVRVHPDKDRFVILNAWAQKDKEKEYGPAVIEACKGFEIL